MQETPLGAAMGTETPKHSSTLPSISTSLKRKLQVYVEIPPSPIHSAAKMKHEAFRTQLSKQSEARPHPLSPKHLNRPPFVEILRSSDSPFIKKPRLSNVEVVIVRNPPAKPKPEESQKTCLRFKDDSSKQRCHQCCKSRSTDDLVYCSNNGCKKRYCESCLRNRYALSIEGIKADGTPSGPQVIRHSTREYTWSCMKCTGNCNCPQCMRTRGLEPLGKNTALRFHQPSVQIVGNNNAVGAARVPQADAKKNPNASGSSLPAAAKAKPTVTRKRRPAPQPSWSPVPTELSFEEVASRFFLREFVLRFEQLMDLSGIRLDELEQFETLPIKLVKSLLQNFLNLIAADVAEEPKRIIKDAIKQVTGPKQSPAMLWPPIEKLRSSLASTSFHLDIPEPSPQISQASSSRGSCTPPPPVHTLPTRTARTVQHYTAGFSSKPTPVLRRDIVDPEQYLPVLIFLAHTALQLPSCRAEIDNGVTDIKEENRRYWAAMKEENERWTEESRLMNEEKENTAQQVGAIFDVEAWTTKFKAAQAAHKEATTSLENEHTLKCQAWHPRFSPLGKDMHGRVYFAGTAFSTKTKCTKDEAGELERWSWFLAVWGKGGPAPDQAQEEEKWWGFHDPAEIKKLAKWLGATALEEEERLKEHGVNDGWRVKEDSEFASIKFSGEDLDDDDDDDESEGAFQIRLKRSEQCGRRRLPNYKEVTELTKSLTTYASVLESRFAKEK